MGFGKTKTFLGVSHLSFVMEPSSTVNVSVELRRPSLVTSKSYFIGSKPVFGRQFWNFSPSKVKKIILHEVRFNPREVRFNQTSENSKFIWHQLPKSQKLLPFKIEISNKNQTRLSLSQSSTWTCCQQGCRQSWQAVITKKS